MIDLLLFALLPLGVLLAAGFWWRRFHGSRWSLGIFWAMLATLFSLAATAWHSPLPRNAQWVVAGSPAAHGGLARGQMVSVEAQHALYDDTIFAWWEPWDDERERDAYRGLRLDPAAATVRSEPSPSIAAQTKAYASGAAFFDFDGQRVRSMEEVLGAISSNRSYAFRVAVSSPDRDLHQLVYAPNWAAGISHAEALGLEGGGAIVHGTDPAGVPVRGRRIVWVGGVFVHGPTHLWRLTSQNGDRTHAKDLFGRALPWPAEGFFLHPSFRTGPGRHGSFVSRAIRQWAGHWWRATWYFPESAVDLWRTWPSLPKAWYQVGSLSWQALGYWLFRLSTLAVSLSLVAFAAAAAGVGRQKSTPPWFWGAAAALALWQLAADLFWVAWL